LSKFTTTVITLNPTVGSGWNVMWSPLTCCPTLSKVKILGQSDSGKHRNTGQQRSYEFYYLLPFGLWTSYLAKILFLKGCDNLFLESPSSTKIFNGLQHSFQVWRRFIKVLESFSYKDSSFVLATIRKEDFRINSTFRSDFLVYLRLLNSDKSDCTIFRIIIFRFLLILFLVFGLLLLILVNCKWASYKST